MKGKYANRAGVRAATAAEQRTAELECELEDVKRLNAERETLLRLEVDSLKGRLLREVKTLAGDQVLQAKQEAINQVVEERNGWENRAAEAAAVLARHNVIMPPRGWEDLAEALRVPLGVIIRDTPNASRAARRVTGRMASRLEAMQNSGRTY